MFRFKKTVLADILCPSIQQGQQCALPNCVFSHTKLPPPETNKKRESPEAPLAKVVKKRRLSNTSSEKPLSNKPTKSESPEPSLPRKNVQENARPAQKPTSSLLSRLTAEKTETAKKPAAAPVQKPAAAPVQKPPSSTASKLTAVNAPVKPSSTSSEPEVTSFAPLAVTPFAPAPYPQRMSFLKHVYEEVRKTNKRNPKTAAVRLEYKVAKSSSKVTYPREIKGLILKLKRGLPVNGEDENSEDAKQKQERAMEKALDDMVVMPDILEQNGFAVEPVVAETVPSGIVVDCARCRSKIIAEKVMSSGPCHYHWAKLAYNTHTKKLSNIYPCCGAEVGESKGCTRCQHHVYRFTELKYLAHYIPFVFAPKTKTPKTLFAAGIDCEMGFTSHGYEMIRVTVVDWATGKTVLDRTVYPYGKVIDLNTRFSGISNLDEGLTVDGVLYPTLSFKQARDALFEYVNRSTIIIGHGLENDLAVIRLIHTRIVDTSILYTREKSNKKMPLKDLVQMYLGRVIQRGEHDSAEDAIGSIDVVRVKIKESLGLTKIKK